MKSLSWILPVGIVGYLIYQAQLAKNTVNQLTSIIFGIKYNKAQSNLLQSQLLVTLRINNPTFNSVSFTSFQGTVYVSGKNIANAIYNPGNGITIKAGTYTDVVFPVNISHSSITTIATLVSEWLKGNFNQDIRIVGVLSAGGIQIPTDTTVKLASLGSLGRINGTPHIASSIYSTY